MIAVLHSNKENKIFSTNITEGTKVLAGSFTGHCSCIWGKTQQALNKTYKATWQSLMEEVKKYCICLKEKGNFREAEWNYPSWNLTSVSWC